MVTSCNIGHSSVQTIRTQSCGRSNYRTVIRSSCGIENDLLFGSKVRHPLASVMGKSILVASLCLRRPGVVHANISNDFRVPQSTKIEPLLLVGCTHDLQTLSDRFDCSELLDYCKTRGT